MVVGKFGLCRRAGSRRRAFTLVELLVVISIIGMLMALLLPAVQQAREAGRRNTCNNNMRNCALAITNFSGAKGSYPGYVDQLSVTPATAGTITTSPAPPITLPVSWIVMVLPYLERTDVYNIYRNQSQWGAATGNIGNNQIPPPIYMDVLNCPSSPPAGTQGTPWSVYVANSGMMDIAVPAGSAFPADWQANGVFFNRYNNVNPNLPAGAIPPVAANSAVIANMGPVVSISQDYITLHDGSSLTLMLSENNNVATLSTSAGGGAGSGQWGGNGLYLTGFSSASGYWGMPNTTMPYAGTEPWNCFVFWPDQSPHPGMKINAPVTVNVVSSPSAYSYDYTPHPSSNHPTIVNVAFCDGHCRTISQDIDYGVFCLMMTPYGQQTNTPGVTTGLDDFNDPAGTGGSNSTYYPSGKNNYYQLRIKPLEEAQIN